MDANEMLLIHNAKLILACCVDDLGGVFDALVLDGLEELVLDSGVVTLDKVLLDELHGHGRLANGTGPDDGDLSCSLWRHV